MTPIRDQAVQAVDQVKDHAIEVAVSKVTYAASGGALILGLTANEFAAIGGIVVAFLALVINSLTTWYFKDQHLRLARQQALAGKPSIEVGDD